MDANSKVKALLEGASSEDVKYDRRGFLGSAVTGIVAAQLGVIASADAPPSKTNREMRPWSWRRPTPHSAH
jgi:hypothetical protein